MDEAMDFLTGAPSERFDIEELTHDEAYSIIKAADQANYIITCATAGNGNDKEKN
jgi:hypothetical protein